MAQSDPTSKRPGQPNAPAPQIAGKPFVFQFSTPILSDRILSVLKDSRAGGYELPEKGSKFAGTDAAKFEDYLFATAKPSESSPGWVTWFYVNERANSDSFNYAIDYPYTDHEYPRFTRTYVLLREDVVEPTSDDVDPVFNEDVTPSSPELLLTDHKQVRLEDPILDALFVGVQRVYERLPGPIITSYEQNAVKQIVTVETQAVKDDPDPVESDATTESLKVERTTTAKSTVTRGRVPEIYPKLEFQNDWGSAAHGVPIEFRSRIRIKTTRQIVAGTPIMPPVDTGDFSKVETEVTEFTKQIETTHFEVENFELTDHRVNAEGQVVTIQKIIDPDDQSVDTGALVESSKVEHIGDDATVKTTETVPEVFTRLDLETSIPDNLPPEFQTEVPSFREAITAEGSPENPPTLGPGITRHREYELTKFVKRIEVTKRDYGSLPKTVIDKKLTEEYGGGILDVIRVVDDIVLEPEEGYDVVSSFVKNLGNGIMVRETERVEGGIWPTLYGSITEDSGIFAGLKVNYEKTVVPVSTPDPGGYTTLTPIDKWRSIQIVNRLDLGPIADHSLDTEEPVSSHISLPAQLTKIIGNWSNSGGYTEEGDNGFRNAGLATAKADTHAVGRIGILYEGGFNGLATGRLVRTFWPGPPPAAPNAIKIRPSSGYVTMQYGNESGTRSSGKDFGSISVGGGITREILHVDGLLVGTYTVEGANFSCIPEFASANSGVYSATVGVFGPLNFLQVHLDPSTPTSIPSGSEILWDVRVVNWRFGVKVLELIYYKVP